jgi:hypothetical protein
MPHERLSAYLDRIERALRAFHGVYAERYEEEILTPTRGNLRIRLRFDGGQLLELNEAVVVEQDRLCHLHYRYHFQDPAGRLIFRYDSTPHFPGLPHFPHHRHNPNGVQGCNRPDVVDVLQEALNHLSG